MRLRIKKGVIGLTIAAALSVALSGCGKDSTDQGNVIINGMGDAVKASGTFAEKTVDIPDGVYKLSAYSISSMNGTMEIIITNTGSSKCVISADDNIIDDLRLDISDSEIKFSGDSSKMYQDFKCKITLDVPVNSLNVSGAYTVEYTVPETDNVEVMSEGACTINASGKIANGKFVLTGSSVLNAFDLKCDKVDVRCDGASKANVYAADSISAEANGASSVVYDGNPGTVTSNPSTASTIEAK